MSALEAARAVADTVLYEGYLLYPYRAGAAKNRVRWQWGVLMPADVAARDPSERSGNRTDLVLDGGRPTLRVRVRFLQVQHRLVEDAGSRAVDRLETPEAVYLPWDEAREHELVVDIPLPAPGGRQAATSDFDTTIEIPGGTEREPLADGAGALVRRCLPLAVGVRSTAVRPVSPYPVTTVSIRVENRTAPGPGRDRPAWLRRALVACHLVLEADGASFVSQLDPPVWAAPFVQACRNDGLFPVLAGPPGQSRVMLSSPIILYDHPELAPQSEAAFFDALEIDELLSLRTLTLSEAEKREMRGTDPRVAALLDQVEDMPDELWDRLHGTVRYLDSMTGGATTGGARAAGAAPPEDPWWDPAGDASVDPERDAVRIAGVDVRRGSRVVLRPSGRADAHDIFLAGRTARVAAVLLDVDGRHHLAVTLDDDPGADLMAAHGRYLYFAPDEVEPIQEGRS